MQQRHTIGPQLSLQDIRSILTENKKLILGEEAMKKIRDAREYLDKRMLSGDELIYGVNTGFGALHNTRIPHTDMEALQRNMVMSHAAGTGEKIPPEIVRLMLLLKIQSLAYGHSGVHEDTVNRLIDFFNHDIFPIIYSQGSLGASGDLAPLAHLVLPMLGLGEVFHDGQEKSGEDVLKQFHWEPLRLRSKEGIALLNGTQFMLAFGVHCLLMSDSIMHWADTIASLSMDAFDCSPAPLHASVHRVRSHGQSQTAESMRSILQGSDIIHRKKEHVQDPYSFRCVPQVHGATHDALMHVRKVMETEIHSVTDNPLIFPDEDLILSAGNFHGQPLALALDFYAMAVAELGSISERRTYLLISGQRGLPPFLIAKPGIHSGLMIPQYTAASIVSQNKQLCMPASVDSIPSSNGQEDHVSMGANAATKAWKVMENVKRILAIELMTAAQALDFRRPLRTSPKLEKLMSAYRNEIPFLEHDRVMYEDIGKTVGFLERQKS